MGGLENEMAAGGDRRRLRASHADREHVIDTFKAAYVYGLVTKDEFDARVSQTLASRTYAELALVTADIPAGLAAAPPPLKPAPATANAAARTNALPGTSVPSRRRLVVIHVPICDPRPSMSLGASKAMEKKLASAKVSVPVHWKFPVVPTAPATKRVYAG